MVLNHASLSPSDEGRTLAWLRDMALGMKALIAMRVCSLQQGFRMNNEGCAVFQSILFGQSGATSNPNMREELQFLMILGTRTPLISDADADLEDRFGRCEAKSLPPEDGEPLLFCALTDGIAVGFPSEEVWARDELTVHFEEFLPDDTFEEASETIDNLTRSSHAQSIYERHLESLRKLEDRDALWNARGEAYSSIKFLPQVEEQIEALDSIAWTRVVRALSSIQTGSMMNAKGLGGGVSEFRLHFGPGYRVYFGQYDDYFVILRCGTKNGQSQDILVARNLWQTYREGG